jgi:two-component system, sensor histidine kinase YesM
MSRTAATGPREGPGRGFYRDWKLRYKIMACYLALVLAVVLALGLFSRSMLRRSVQDYERALLVQNVTELNTAIDSFLEIYLGKSDMLFDNVDLQRALTHRNADLLDVMQSHAKVRGISYQFLSDFRYPFMKGSYYFGGSVKAIWYVANDTLTPDGQEIMSIHDVEGEPWCASLLGSPEAMLGWQSAVTYKRISYVTMARKLKDFSDGSVIGVLRIFIPAARVRDIIESNAHDPEYSFAYLDGGRRIVSIGRLAEAEPGALSALACASPGSGVHDLKLGGSRYIGGCLESNVTGWRLVYLAPLSAITSKTGFVDLIALLTMALAGGACVAIAVMVASFVTRRVGILVEKTNRVAAGNLTVDVAVTGADEIGQLDRNFNGMVRRVRELIEHETRTRTALETMRLELLQEQFNPHLLANTLAAISHVAREAGDRTISTVADGLMSFYRSILNDGRIIWSLGAEVDLCRRYCDLVRFTYGLDADVELDVEEPILGCYSIKLFLQPIVENAIMHGLRARRGGSLVVASRTAGAGIEFRVSDDGAGMSEERLRAVREARADGTRGRGYGLSNVRRRIGLFYGDPYGVEIQSAPGEGTTVTVRIPRLTLEEIRGLLEEKFAGAWDEDGKR